MHTKTLICTQTQNIDNYNFLGTSITAQNEINTWIQNQTERQNIYFFPKIINHIKKVTLNIGENYIEKWILQSMSHNDFVYWGHQAKIYVKNIYYIKIIIFKTWYMNLKIVHIFKKQNKNNILMKFDG